MMEDRTSPEEKVILNLLLDRYERSKWFLEGHSAQRVLLKVTDLPDAAAWMENAGKWRSFLNALARLKEQNVLDYEWVRYERDNLVENIWLCTDPAAVRKAYALAGRKPKARELERLRGQLTGTLSVLIPGTDLAAFLEECIEMIDQKKRIPRFFAGDEKAAQGILAFLEEIDRSASSGQDEQSERTLSTRLYGDSKYFERFIKGKILSILRYIDTDGLDNEQLLKERGVVRWPQIFEFTGPVTLEMTDGGVISFAPLSEGAYINSGTLSRISKVRLPSLKRILFIENKANYVDYVFRRREMDELVIYHGGVFSPAAGKWFALLQEARKNCCPDTPCFHWSDIDLGGFQIFVRLRNTLIPDLKPWLMDRKTLMENKDRCMKLESRAYADKLKALLEKKEYELFHDVIGFMLREGIRLEQEALIQDK